jgi:quercetin dioxygenase-like cupin family protein
MTVQNFFFGNEREYEDLGGGVKRKILSYDQNLMTVEVVFEKGAVGAMHHHPHEQCTIVLEGAFEFTIGDETKVVRKGDSLYKQPNIEHGCVCLEAGKLLDVFTPRRDDFLK